jgi:predicted aldo/keto reductase-like oxidoreductase
MESGEEDMNRRHFLKIGGIAALGASLLRSYADEGSPGGLECRPLGRTGHYRSVVTLGGIVVMNEDQAEADRLVGEALDAGVNGVDVAPTYGDAELKLGHALRGKRDQVFLACKTTKRDRAGAAEELRKSLQRLETDYFDLYQLHGLDKPEELEQVLGPGGALEAFQEAKEAGLIRFLGITGHRPETLLAAIRRFDFATVMFPYNFILAHYGYGQELLAEARRRNLGVLAIKPIAMRAWEPGEIRTAPKCWYKPFSTHHEISLAVRWALAQPITTVVPSGDMTLFRRALKAAQHLSPLRPEEIAELQGKAEQLKPLFG